jgi:hypothetical protein
MIVDHVCEMVGRVAVRLHYDEVFFQFLLLKRPIDGVAKLEEAERVSLEADGMGLAGSCAAAGLLLPHRSTRTGVRRRLSRLMELTLLLLEILRLAKTSIGVATVNELLDVITIDV